MSISDSEKSRTDTGDKKDLAGNVSRVESQLRISRYRKSSDSEISGVFSAPPGVNPFHVAAAKVRKSTTG